MTSSEKASLRFCLDIADPDRRLAHLDATVRRILAEADPDPIPPKMDTEPRRGGLEDTMSESTKQISVDVECGDTTYSVTVDRATGRGDVCEVREGRSYVLGEGRWDGSSFVDCPVDLGGEAYEAIDEALSEALDDEPTCPYCHCQGFEGRGGVVCGCECTDADGRPLPSLEVFEAELVRLGVDESALGPVDSIGVQVEGGIAQIADDGAVTAGLPVQALLTALRALPAGAGWEAVWGAVDRVVDGVELDEDRDDPRGKCSGLGCPGQAGETCLGCVYWTSPEEGAALREAAEDAAWDREAADAAIVEEEARQRADDEDRPRRIAEAQKVVDTFRAEEDRRNLAEGRIVWAPLADEGRHASILALDGGGGCEDCGCALSGQPEACPGCSEMDDDDEDPEGRTGWEFRPRHTGGAGVWGTEAVCLEALDVEGCGDAYGPGGEHSTLRCDECSADELDPDTEARR